MFDLLKKTKLDIIPATQLKSSTDKRIAFPLNTNHVIHTWWICAFLELFLLLPREIIYFFLTDLKSFSQ